MIGEGDILADVFNESIINSMVEEKMKQLMGEEKIVDSEFRQYQYELSLKMARRQPVTKSDAVHLTQLHLRHLGAMYALGHVRETVLGNAEPTYVGLLKSELTQIEKGEISLSHLDYLSKLISNSKKRVLIGRKWQKTLNNLGLETQFFDAQLPNAPLQNAAIGVMEGQVQDIAWLPYFVQAGEQCLKILRQEVEANDAVLPPVDFSMEQKIRAFFNDDSVGLGGIEAEWHQIETIVNEFLPDLAEAPDFSKFNEAEAYITNEAGRPFKVLRLFETNSDESAQVIEGRFVTDDEHQFSDSNFFVFLRRRP
ncbi:hypothetical protein KBC79_05545 [Candidatus Woesebacteria bacterium]|nr:hypothetical protein [Candidatus Woesebacteria bacterium]